MCPAVLLEGRMRQNGVKKKCQESGSADFPLLPALLHPLPVNPYRFRDLLGLPSVTGFYCKDTSGNWEATKPQGGQMAFYDFGTRFWICNSSRGLVIWSPQRPDEVPQPYHLALQPISASTDPAAVGQHVAAAYSWLPLTCGASQCAF